MDDRFERNEFLIKDLVIKLPSSGGGGGGTFLPADDDTDIPWWLSPVVSVLVKGRVLETVNATIREAVETGSDFTDIALAWDGDPDGNPSIRLAIEEIGRAVIAGAAYTAIGGSVGYPDPNCGGTSLETIPPTLTPIVHMGGEVLQISHLPAIKKRLAVAMDTIERVSEGLEPRGEQAQHVGKALEAALEGIRR